VWYDSSIFATVTQLFFYFDTHFLDLVRGTVTQPFCYSVSVILKFHQSFFIILSTTFKISLCTIMAQPFFTTLTQPVFNFVMLRCSDSTNPFFLVLAVCV
jgi:hypothetical protein